MSRLIGELADAAAQRRQQGTLIIAIDGFGCCGKSTLAQALAQHMDGLILETDDFQQPDGGTIEPDSPLSYRRWTSLQATVTTLANGRAACYAPIDWGTHRLGAELEVMPKARLIIDGIGAHALGLPAHALRVFVDGRAESRMQRVAARDGAQFADWDRYVAIELSYFRRFTPWRTADVFVLGAELTFGNSREGFARRMEVLATALPKRLDQPCS
jgi:hypothetical protein